MENTYGCIRTSRQRIEGSAGSAPEAQAHQLRQEGVPEANIYRDVGISGGTGTNSRAGWRALDSKLVSGILWWQWPSMAWSLGRIGSSVREVGTDVEKAAAAVATGAIEAAYDVSDAAGDAVRTAVTGTIQGVRVVAKLR